MPQLSEESWGFELSEALDLAKWDISGPMALDETLASAIAKADIYQ